MKVMCLLARMREEVMALTTTLSKSVSDKLDMSLLAAIDMKRKWCGDGRYEILADEVSYIVDLEKEHYNCGEWQISGIPCDHEVKCLNLDREDVASSKVTHYLQTPAL